MAHRVRTITALLAAAFVAAAAPAQARPAEAATGKRPITHEDVWTMRRLSAPALSPDGRLVVVGVTEPSYDRDATRSDLWLVPTDGSAAPRRLTATSGGESAVVWSPDGARIAFTAKRDGDDEAQVYVLPIDGPGEAQRVTAAERGAANPQWSPDGTRLLYETLCESPIPRRVEMADGVAASAYEGFPVRYWDRWLDRMQPRVIVQPVDDPAAAVDVLAASGLVRQVGFGGTPGRGRDGLSAIWAPDGRSVVFVATTERDRSAYAPVRYRLWRVDAKAAPGEPVAVSPDGAVTASAPQVVPGTQRVWWLEKPVGEFVFEHSCVVSAAADGADAARLMAGFDLPIDELAGAGPQLFVLATERGRVHLFGCDPAGAVRALTPEPGGVYSGLAVSHDGAAMVARWEDATHPAEIVRIDPATGTRAAITAFNRDRVGDLDWQPFREFWFESSRGRRIHCWLALPPSFDPAQQYPLLTWMHGGPHSTCLDRDHVRWSPHLMTAPGYVVLMVDYTGSVGYGEAFAQAIQGDPLRTPGEELLEAARAVAAAHPFVDLDRQAALGASYGGHLANWLQATTDHFRCLVGHAGLASLEGQWATSDVVHHREVNNGGPPWGDSAIWREQSPMTHAADFRTPMLLTIGEKDYRVPLNQTLAMWTCLQRQRVESRLVAFHDSNHWIMDGEAARYFWREVHDWLRRHLGD